MCVQWCFHPLWIMLGEGFRRRLNVYFCHVSIIFQRLFISDIFCTTNVLASPSMLNSISPQKKEKKTSLCGIRSYYGKEERFAINKQYYARKFCSHKSPPFACSWDMYIYFWIFIVNSASTDVFSTTYRPGVEARGRIEMNVVAFAQGSLTCPLDHLTHF